jgi:hypothetical protein
VKQPNRRRRDTLPPRSVSFRTSAPARPPGACRKSVLKRARLRQFFLSNFLLVSQPKASASKSRPGVFFVSGRSLLNE